jgi:hypothetical protein
MILLTSTAPVDRGAWLTVGSARKVREWSEDADLRGRQSRDGLPLRYLNKRRCGVNDSQRAEDCRKDGTLGEHLPSKVDSDSQGGGGTEHYPGSSSFIMWRIYTQDVRSCSAHICW